MPLDRDAVTRKVANLPSLSRTAIEILQSIDDERADTEILARKIAGDQSLVARMLRVANSPFYGLSGRVTTIQDAIVILGLRSVRMLATAASVASGLQRITTPGFDFTVFWRNSIGTALGARLLARRLKVPEEHAFAAGLLHDIGRLALAACFPDHYTAVQRYRQGLDCHLLDAEHAVIGLDHGVIGSLLARRWQFPPLLCDAIGSHHAPADNGVTPLAAIVQVADAIVHALDLAGDATDMVPRLAPEYWQAIGLSWHEAQELMQRLDSEFGEVSELLMNK